MATFRARSSGTVEACIRRKQIGGAIYLTFKSMEEAERYCKEAEALIDSGQSPDSLIARIQPGRARREDTMMQTLGDAIVTFLREYHVTEGDKQWLAVLREEVGGESIGAVTVQWALGQVKQYKAKRLAPSTIRHRIGALRRCLDWHVTMGNLPINPVKMLPTRYASYNDADRAGGRDVPDNDNSRDRRFEPGEEGRIRKVLTCDKEYIKELGVERGLNPAHAPEMLMMFEIAVEADMRMREIFTLSEDQVDVNKRTIFLDKTKNGDKRQVPMSSVLVPLLSDWQPRGTGGLLFSFWNGDLNPAALKRVTSKLSGRWRTVARLAKCNDLHFHDLRHESTSRLFERTTLDVLSISRITGHRDLKMLRRYSNLRGSDLAEKLW